MNDDLRTLTDGWRTVEAAVKAMVEATDLSVEDETREGRRQLAGEMAAATVTVEMAAATKRLFRDSGTLLEWCGELAKTQAMDPKNGTRRQRQIAVLILLTLKQEAPAVRNYLALANALGAMSDDTGDEDTNEFNRQFRARLMKVIERADLWEARLGERS
jgi:hypothetical protein